MHMSVFVNITTYSAYLQLFHSVRVNNVRATWSVSHSRDLDMRVVQQSNMGHTSWFGVSFASILAIIAFFWWYADDAEAGLEF